MKLEENAIEDELMVDLRRRLRVINSPEYRACASLSPRRPSALRRHPVVSFGGSDCSDDADGLALDRKHLSARASRERETRRSESLYSALSLTERFRCSSRRILRIIEDAIGVSSVTPLLAAIDIDRLTGYPLTAIGNKESDQFSTLAAVAGVAQRNKTFDARLPRFRRDRDRRGETCR